MLSNISCRRVSCSTPSFLILLLVVCAVFSAFFISAGTSELANDTYIYDFYIINNSIINLKYT